MNDYVSEQIHSPWLKKILITRGSEKIQNAWFSLDFWLNKFTMVEESLDFQSFEKHQNASYFLLDFCVNTFTMVEENFDF